MKKLLLLLAIQVAFISISKAATVTWDGGASTNNWTDAMNWSTNTLPTAIDEAYISSANVTLTGMQTVQRVYLTGTANLTVNMGSTLSVFGSVGTDAFQVQSSASFINNGTVNILGVTGSGTDALLAKGTFTNNGTLSISGAGQHGLYLQGSTFMNSAGATINITNVAQDASHASSGDGIYVDDNGGSPSFLTNNGTIVVNMTVGDDGIYINDSSVVINNDSIYLDGVGSTDNGIRIDDRGTFDNAAGASLTINTTPDDQLFLDNTGAFINSGTVNLMNSSDIGLYVTDDGLFTNMASGIVNISNSSNYAMQLDANVSGTAKIVNNGIMNTNGGKDGLRLQENGAFDNNATGTLTIVAPNEDGINFQSSVGTLNNYGTIDISNATLEGLDMASGTLTNFSGALFKAVDNAQDNIEVENATLNNRGAMSLYRTGSDGSGRDDIELKSGGLFTNNPTATFTPGSSPGELEVRGAFDLGTSTTTFEINGTSHTSTYDRIEKASSTSSIAITNATAVLDWGTFIPAVNDTFRIIDGGGTVTGTFATITNPNPAIVYLVDYSDPSEVRLVITASPLPVNLIDFTAALHTNGVQLDWSTENEVNNLGFDIERSKNGTDFSKIGFVKGEEAVSKSSYTFVDQAPHSGLNYYRLKQLDIDGNFEYSEVIAVQYENSAVSYSFYPNPVNDILYIEASGIEKNIEIKLIDLYGKILWSGNKIQPISLNEFSAGTYFVQITSAQQQTIFKVSKK